MEIVILFIAPAALLGLVFLIGHLSHKDAIELEKVKMKCAMELRAAHEDDRREQHQRQLSELRAIGESKGPLNPGQTARPMQERKQLQPASEPSVSPDSFESTPSLKVASQTMMSVPREHLADMGVFVEEEREQQF
jgi:hypothetical protein